MQPVYSEDVFVHTQLIVVICYRRNARKGETEANQRPAEERGRHSKSERISNGKRVSGQSTTTLQYCAYWQRGHTYTRHTLARLKSFSF